MNRKKVIIVSLVGFILLIIIIFIIQQIIARSINTQPTIVPTPIPTLAITTASPSEPEVFSILTILPKENINYQTIPVQQIEINFTKQIDPNMFRYTVNPKTALIVKNKANDPKSIIITADPVWSEGISTLTILKTTQAKDGTVLGKDTVYRLNAKFPGDEGFREFYE